MKDVIINSFIAGASQTLLGHPFDTLKTLKQLNPQVPTFKLIKKINKGFYKGYFPALLGGCLQNSFLFTTENAFSKKFNPFMSGFISGSITSLVISPSEYIKSNQQINRQWKYQYLMRGLSLTLLRDSIGFGIYFGSYQYLQNQYQNPFLNGGIAGMLSWTYSYPFDTVKTKFQTSKLSLKQILRETNFKDSLKGLNIMLMRAFVVNAGIFYIFEKLK